MVVLAAVAADDVPAALAAVETAVAIVVAAVVTAATVETVTNPHIKAYNTVAAVDVDSGAGVAD